MKASFAVHSYDEGSALRRLVLSSLPLAPLIHEWVIVDHRSTDDTPAVCEELADALRTYSIALRYLKETRDLSRRFTFADIRNITIRACSAPVVALHDADFILGPGYKPLLERALRALCGPSPYHGASYSIPVVWDHIRTDADGIVREHGRVWVHNSRPRILLRSAVYYSQTKEAGRWEKLHVTQRSRPERLRLSQGVRGLAPDSVLSLNVKPAERIALRDTMTMYMQDAMQGRATGTWLEDYHAGKTRSQGAYDYHNPNLRGWHTYVSGLELVA